MRWLCRVHTNLRRLGEVSYCTDNHARVGIQSVTTMEEVVNSLLNSAVEPMLTEEGMFCDLCRIAVS